MKKIHTAVTLIIIFFMVAALYICGRYEKAPDRIFTGKVSAPEGEWTIDISGGDHEYCCFPGNDFLHNDGCQQSEEDK